MDIGKTIKKRAAGKRAMIKSLAAIALMRMIAWWPLPMVRVLGRVLGRVLVWSKSDWYRTAIRNFQLCFPDESALDHHKRACQSLAHTGQALTEAAVAWLAPAGRQLGYIEHVTGQALLEAALKRNTGLLLVTPHLGAWEWLNGYLSLLSTFSALYKGVSLPELERFIAAKRVRFGIQFYQGDSMGLRSYVRAFLQGNPILILPDQEPRVKGSVFAPFFGVPTLTPRLVSNLLQKKPEASALMVCALRTLRGFEIHIEPLDARVYAADAVVAATGLNKSLEKAIMRAPDQYLWCYKRFRVRPEGEKSPYYLLKYQFR